MDNLFLILFLISIICLIIGLIKPQKVIRWGDTSKKTRKNVLKYFGISLVVSFVLFGITAPETQNATTQAQIETSQIVDNQTEIKEDTKVEDNSNDNYNEENEKTKDTSDVDMIEVNSTNSTEDIFAGYTLIEVDGGNLSGYREPNVVVDIGFGDRKYYAFTNEYGQLVKVIAKEIILQDDSTELVNSNGRYYEDEAKVPGVESNNLDEGHVIADSLGGVSNAYNITPQNSTLNRHGDQAYMEKVIRDAGGCTDFVAIITYPDTTTQIPSHYSYTYKINGNLVNDEFDNINPDEYNAKLSDTSSNNSAYDNKDSGTSSSNTGTTTNEPAQGTRTVYWTPSGKSYHYSKSCRTLSRSKNILEGPASECPKTDPCDVCAK